MSQDVSTYAPRVLAGGLLALRQAAWMPRFVNRGYDPVAAQKGSSIDIPIPASVAAAVVSPGATPPSTADITPSVVSIVLDKLYEAPFYLTDKELAEVDAGILPGQASEAVKSLANQINGDILALGEDIFGYVGTAGTTPFASDLQAAIDARKALFEQLAPPQDQVLVIDGAAEAKALALAAIQQMQIRGSTQGIVDGQIGRILGFDWYAHQLVPSHTAGTITAGLISKASTAYAVGVKTLVATTAASTGACALKRGDIILFAGDTQTYVLTADATQASAATDVTIAFEPGLKVAHVGSEAITVKATHRNNLAFQRGAFAFATRPLDNPQGIGHVDSATDAASGLTLRLEITREHKRTRWSFDVLYGVKTIRRELACRVAG